MKWTIPILALLAACAAPPDGTGTASDPEMAQPAPSDGFGGIDGLERPEAEFEVLSACLDDTQMALVGQPVAQARAILPPTARIIGPDDIFTQDYRPTRVNADYNAAGIVTRMWCG